MTALAIKPTRREVLYLILQEARKRKTAESQEIHKQADACSAQATEIRKKIDDAQIKAARGRSMKEYRAAKKFAADHPTVRVSECVRYAKEGESPSYNMPDDFKGPIVYTLTVSGNIKEDMVPLAEMENMEELIKQYNASRKEAQRLHDEANKLARRAQMLQREDFLQEVVTSLGAEAVPHLDALVGMVVAKQGKKHDF
jgi:hypothetical protein